MSSRSFAGRTAVISGGSRGIGLAIALSLAAEGANIVLLAKTAAPHPRLPGTVHTAAAEIEEAGGRAVAVVGDVRNVDDIRRAVDAAVEAFGGVDICINNASVLNLSPTDELPMSRFDLMHQVNVRGTFALARECLPHLRTSEHGRILTLSPPLNLSDHWLGKHPGYMLAKYGMTLAALGLAAEQRPYGIASNCLWPETTIATAAVRNLLGGDDAVTHARSPQIVADAALHVLALPAEITGQCFIDSDVLRTAGVADLTRYGGAVPVDYDIFVDPR